MSDLLKKTSQAQKRDAGTPLAGVECGDTPFERPASSAGSWRHATPDDREDGAPVLVPTLLSIGKSVRALRGIKLAALGFNNGQDELLMAIPVDGMPVSFIAEALMIRPSTVSKMADRLVDKGLLVRAGDGRDARRTVVKLTAAGYEARSVVADAMAELEVELTKAIDEDRLPAMEECLSDCADLLKTRLKRLR